MSKTQSQPINMEEYSTKLPNVAMENLKLYDQMFLNILQKEAKIELFLDSVFSFLYRKTDFFRFCSKSNPKMGFPPGHANKLVEGYFTRYMKMSIEAYQEAQQARIQAEKKVEQEGKDEPKITEIENDDDDETEKVEQKQITKEKEIKDEKPVPKKPITQKQLKIDNLAQDDTYNGGTTDKFSWSQTHDELELSIKPPKNVEKANQIKVDFKPNKMKISFKDEKNSFTPYLDTELHSKISAEDSFWSLDRSNPNSIKLSITLTKSNDLWWDRIGKNDEPIDKEQIKAVKPMEDMSIEEQAVIKKLQYDQHQKRLGKATSEQTKALDSLRKGWDAEGSPFKGQEFDPKKFNLDAIN